jgi:hypothetical protein
LDDELELARTIAAIDVDGALREAADGVLAATRGGFLRAAAAGGAALVGALYLPGAGRGAVTAAGAARDVAILRFDLVLEYLQAGLYTEAERVGALTPKTLAWARVVGAHERAHAKAIKGLLGSKAVPSPAFDFHGVTQAEKPFIKTAVAFEELTAALLKWQAERLASRRIVAAVATLHSVETRHAAWIRRIVGLTPATRAFDEPAPQDRMAQLISSTHFVASRPRVARPRRPGFTG